MLRAVASRRPASCRTAGDSAAARIGASTGQNATGARAGRSGSPSPGSALAFLYPAESVTVEPVTPPAFAFDGIFFFRYWRGVSIWIVAMYCWIAPAPGGGPFLRLTAEGVR